MKKQYIFLVILIFNTCVFAQNTEPLKFNENGEFKILQFTDLHWTPSSGKTQKTTETMRSVIQKEKPDFIVLTGDLVTDEPAKKGWLDMTKVLVESQIPWTVTFGNHDEEHNMPKEKIYLLLRKLPYFVGEKGNVSGVLNFDLPIYNHQGNKVSSVLYFLDSHDYTYNPVLGKYDWIKLDQIDWYKKTSKKYTEANGGEKIPSTIYFHIPLLEFNFVANDSASIGDKLEGVASPDVNSGLFSAILEQKDIMGVFVGHDHDNNYIGNYKNVALGFGNVTGDDAYGDLERGGRVIILKEGKFQFESYIVTPTQKKYVFNYPSGLATITKDTKVLPSVSAPNVKKGIKVDYFEGEIESVKEIKNLKVKSSAVTHQIDLSPAQVDNHFALKFTGYFYAPSTNFYKFYLYSDDGSTLSINNQIIIDNDGGHSPIRKEGTVALEKGFHPIEILYFEDYMGQILEVGFSSIEHPEQALNDTNLFH